MMRGALSGGVALAVIAALGCLGTVPGSALKPSEPVDTDGCPDGFAARESGDLSRATAAFTSCVETHTRHLSDAYYQRGQAFVEQRDYPRAIADFDLALALDSKHAEAYRGRAWAYYLMGDLSRAEADILRARVERLVSPYSVARMLDTHAHILAAKGNVERAIELFEEAMKRHTRDRIAELQRGLARQGFDPGTINGVYSADTRAAIEACVKAACNIWK